MNPVNLLKNVMQKNIDDIISFNPTLKGAGAENIGKMFNERFGDARISKEAFEGIDRNITDFGLDASTATQEQLFKGVSGASQYKGNFITQAFNTDGGSGFGGALMGAGLGMAGAAAVGADAREGAVFGAMAGFGAAATGRAIMKNAGSIEENFMNSLLKGAREQPTAVSGSMDDVARAVNKNVDNVTFDDMIGAGYGDRTAREILNVDDNAIKSMYQAQRNANKIEPGVTEAEYIGGFNTKLNTIDSGNRGSSIIGDNLSGVDTDLLTPTAAVQGSLRGGALDLSAMSRKQKFDAVAKLSPQEIKEAGFGGEFKRDVLAGTKDLNVAQYTRMTGAIGSALTGMGFSAKRRDHRRGFNSKRGNRV